MLVGHAVGGSARPLISLVFPAFNPGAGVENTWRQIQEFQHWAPADWEFLFVCDGCTDGTAERLRLLTREAGDLVRVLSYEPNRGKGFAVRQGLAAARGHWRLFTDVDMAYSFADITRLADTLRQGADVAIASRVHPESRLLVPPHLLGYLHRRRLQSQAFAALARWILPIAISDTQAGLKGLSARAAELLLPRLTCCGFEFDCELLTACARLGLKVAEVPVTVRYDDGASTTGFRKTIAMLGKLWSIRRAWSEEVLSAGPLVELPRQKAA
jgi:dolichyl-phosphate beta-glucosyltransferase